MAESTKVQLKDVAGTPVYPVTTADQVKTADGGNVDAKIKALEATFASGIRQKGTVGTGGTVEALPADSYTQGDMYIVKTGGTYAGQVCEPGDLILCIKTFAEEAADTDWTVIQNNIDRAVKGPESAADGNLYAAGLPPRGRTGGGAAFPGREPPLSHHGGAALCRAAVYRRRRAV